MVVVKIPIPERESDHASKEANQKIKTEKKPARVPLREGYQPIGDKVDLSKIMPPKQKTAAKKPQNSDK